jgi:hypothetical protein
MQLAPTTREEDAHWAAACPLPVLADDPWVLEAASRRSQIGNKAYTGREWTSKPTSTTTL